MLQRPASKKSSDGIRRDSPISSALLPLSHNKRTDLRERHLRTGLVHLASLARTHAVIPSVRSALGGVAGGDLPPLERDEEGISVTSRFATAEDGRGVK